MKNYSILALMTFLLLGNVSLAHAAGACVDLGKAIALADWAVKVNKYSQGDRSCSACTSKHPSGMPGAPVAGPPNVTGMCCSYDCSSLTTWIVRQVPGQTAVPPGNVAPPTTYGMWGSGGPKQGGSPNGWKPCDPSKQPLCVALSAWGRDGMPGPGHVTVALCGKHYSASCTGCSPDITDTYKGGKDPIYVTPPGLDALTIASCSSSCTSTSAAVSPGQGSANPTGTSSAAPAASSSNSSSSDTMSQMMPMMMMSMMMQQMMQMMKPSSSGSSSSSGSGNGTGASSGGSSSGGLGDLLGNLLGKPGSSTSGGSSNSGSGSNGSGSSNGTSNSNGAAASSSDVLKTLLSALVTRLKTVLTSIFAASSAQPVAAVQSSSPASTASVLQQQLQQLEEQRAVVKTTTGSAATSSAIVSQPEGSGTDAAPVNPTQDWHKTDGGWSGDRRLSCAGLSGQNAANCRVGRTPSMSP